MRQFSKKLSCNLVEIKSKGEWNFVCGVNLGAQSPGREGRCGFAQPVEGMRAQENLISSEEKRHQNIECVSMERNTETMDRKRHFKALPRVSSFPLLSSKRPQTVPSQTSACGIYLDT